MQGRCETPALGFFERDRRKGLSTAALSTECERAQMEFIRTNLKCKGVSQILIKKEM